MLRHSSSYLRTKSFPILILQYQLCVLYYNLTFFRKMENSSINHMSGQIIPPVVHCCIQDELFVLHSQKVQGYICSGESSCSILYQSPNAGNDLYTRWNHLGENDDCPGPRVWEGYALPQWRVWKWQWLGSYPKLWRPVCVLLSLYKWGSLSTLLKNTIAQCPTSPFTPRCPRSLLFWEGVCQCLTFDETSPLSPGGGLWGKRRSPKCGPRWPSGL